MSILPAGVFDQAAPAGGVWEAARRCCLARRRSVCVCVLLIREAVAAAVLIRTLGAYWEACFCVLCSASGPDNAVLPLFPSVLPSLPSLFFSLHLNTPFLPSFLPFLISFCYLSLISILSCLTHHFFTYSYFLHSFFPLSLSPFFRSLPPLLLHPLHRAHR